MRLIPEDKIITFSNILSLFNILKNQKEEHIDPNKLNNLYFEF